LRHASPLYKSPLYFALIHIPDPHARPTHASRRSVVREVAFYTVSGNAPDRFGSPVPSKALGQFFIERGEKA
jgi:hypothetical protein